MKRKSLFLLGVCSLISTLVILACAFSEADAQTPIPATSPQAAAKDSIRTDTTWQMWTLGVATHPVLAVRNNFNPAGFLISWDPFMGPHYAYGVGLELNDFTTDAVGLGWLQVTKYFTDTVQARTAPFIQGRFGLTEGAYISSTFMGIAGGVRFPIAGDDDVGFIDLNLSTGLEMHWYKGSPDKDARFTLNVLLSMPMMNTHQHGKKEKKETVTP